jgi:predicted metal-dependent HD superfamily phosphohydrolase
MDTVDDGIYQEFKFAHPLHVFAQGRIDVMKSFLNRDQIFISDVFAPHEKQARSNMIEIIAKWSKYVHNRNGYGVV